MNRPLPCTFYGGFRQFKISASDFGTVSMRKQFLSMVIEGVVNGRQLKISASDFGNVSMHREFLTTVIEGVVHGIHKAVIWSSFGVIQRHKGKWRYSGILPL